MEKKNNILKEVLDRKINALESIIAIQENQLRDNKNYLKKIRKERKK